MLELVLVEKKNYLKVCSASVLCSSAGAVSTTVVVVVATAGELSVAVDDIIEHPISENQAKQISY